MVKSTDLFFDGVPELTFGNGFTTRDLSLNECMHDLYFSESYILNRFLGRPEKIIRKKSFHQSEVSN